MQYYSNKPITYFYKTNPLEINCSNLSNLSNLSEVFCSELSSELVNSMIDFDNKQTPIKSNYGCLGKDLHRFISNKTKFLIMNAANFSLTREFNSLEELHYADNPEKDVYFYNSDHIGSSSFITDATGISTQHLQYLPYGELF